MKKITQILLFTFIVSNSYSQDSTFVFTTSGFTDYVVTNINGKSQSDLYKKALDWVSVTYKNPNEVIKAKIENDYLRIEGGNSNMCCTKIMGIKTCNPSKYQIEISLKEGKYKFDVISITQYVAPSQYSSGGWSEVGLPSPKAVELNPEIMKTYYNDDGDPKKLMRLYIENIPPEFNKLNESLKEFLKSDAIPSKKDW